MTTKQTLQRLRAAGKPVSLTHLYRLLKLLGIHPLGSSRPQQYPADTAERVLQHLGFSAASSGNVRATGKLVSVKQLRAARPKSKRKGTK